MSRFLTTTCALEHNHEISDSIFKLYCDQRHPTGQLADEVDSEWQSHSCCTSLTQRRFGRPS